MDALSLRSDVISSIKTHPRGGRQSALERDGYNLKRLKHLYLNPRPDSGLGLLKCCEVTQERLGSGPVALQHGPVVRRGHEAKARARHLRFRFQGLGVGVEV